jgi:hypothetical protein
LTRWVRTVRASVTVAGIPPQARVAEYLSAVRVSFASGLRRRFTALPQPTFPAVDVRPEQGGTASPGREGQAGTFRHTSVEVEPGRICGRTFSSQIWRMVPHGIGSEKPSATPPADSPSRGQVRMTHCVVPHRPRHTSMRGGSARGEGLLTRALAAYDWGVPRCADRPRGAIAYRSKGLSGRPDLVWAKGREEDVMSIKLWGLPYPLVFACPWTCVLGRFGPRDLVRFGGVSGSLWRSDLDCGPMRPVLLDRCHDISVFEVLGYREGYQEEGYCRDGPRHRLDKPRRRSAISPGLAVCGQRAKTPAAVPSPPRMVLDFGPATGGGQLD